MWLLCTFRTWLFLYRASVGGCWSVNRRLGVRGGIRAEAPCLGNGHRCGRFCLAVHVLRHVRLFCCVFPRRVVYYGYYQLS